MSFTILVAFPIVVNGFGRVITCSMRNYMYSIKYKAIPLNYFYSGLKNKSGNTCTCIKFVAQMLKHWCKFITQSIISTKTMQVWLTAVSLYADSVSWNIIQFDQIPPYLRSVCRNVILDTKTGFSFTFISN